MDLASLSPPATASSTPARSPSAETASLPAALPVTRSKIAAMNVGQEQDKVHVHAGLIA